MSGVAGGDRILKADAWNVIRAYIEILKGFAFFKDYRISGSYHSKEDFGDIDLIINISNRFSETKPIIKKRLIDFLCNLSEDTILPFRSYKYDQKRFYNSGEIVTILFTQGNGKTIQIDNIISLSDEETEFKKRFLDMPAEIQGLCLGIIKTIYVESPVSYSNYRKYCLTDNQELEWNLSSSKLELRKVTLTDKFKELDREVMYTTTNWQDVNSLLRGYISLSFEEILEKLDKTLKNPRSRNRIKGLFNSMVSVKSGEVGTPKGNHKTECIKKVNEFL